MEYDSEDYLRGDAPVSKAAWVYLPYGYDEDDTQTRYDIIYLMHGWGGAAGEYFYMGNGMIKNMLQREQRPGFRGFRGRTQGVPPGLHQPPDARR